MREILYSDGKVPHVTAVMVTRLYQFVLTLQIALNISTFYCMDTITQQSSKNENKKCFLVSFMTTLAAYGGFKARG